MAFRAAMTTSSLNFAVVRSALFVLGALLATSSAIALWAALNARARLDQEAVGLAVGSRRALRSVTHDTADFSICRSSRGGPHLAADSNGFVCAQDELQSNGCCVKNSAEMPFACDPCERGCCTEYAHCVACCISPKQTRQRAYLRAAFWSRGYGRERRNDGFALCAAACRSDSNSVIHENAYRAAAHHCFSGFAPDIDAEMHQGIFDFAEPTNARRRKLRSIFWM